MEDDSMKQPCFNLRTACKRILPILIFVDLFVVIIILTGPETVEPGYVPPEVEDESAQRRLLFSTERRVSSLTYNCSSGHVWNCRPQNIAILIEPSVSGCKQAAEPLDLLVIVITTHSHQWRRKVIRENFREQRLRSSRKFSLVFLMGKPDVPGADAIQEQTVNEAAFHGDMLQGDFLDTYPNNTYKALFAMKYFTEACARVPYFMKADDDISLNLAPTLDFIANNVTTNSSLDRFIMGRCDLPRNIAAYRHPLKLKNRLPDSIYPDDYIPPYCAGGSYVLPAAVATDIYMASRWVPLLFVEDIYIGVVMARLKNPVQVLHLPEQYIMGYTAFQAPNLCHRFKEGRVFAIHNKHAEGLEYFSVDCYL